MRVALVLRSAEVQPLFRRFVCDCLILTLVNVKPSRQFTSPLENNNIIIIK